MSHDSDFHSAASRAWWKRSPTSHKDPNPRSGSCAVHHPVCITPGLSDPHRFGALLKQQGRRRRKRATKSISAEPVSPMEWCLALSRAKTSARRGRGRQEGLSPTSVSLGCTQRAVWGVLWEAVARS